MTGPAATTTTAAGPARPVLRGRRREPARPGCGVPPAGEGAEEAESLPGMFLEGGAAWAAVGRQRPQRQIKPRVVRPPPGLVSLSARRDPGLDRECSPPVNGSSVPREAQRRQIRGTETANSLKTRGGGGGTWSSKPGLQLAVVNRIRHR